MAATNGTAIFRGLRSGLSYIKDLYFSDTAGTQINWDGGVGASATSPLDWVPNEHVRLVDFSIVTGAAQTKLQLIRNGIPTGDLLRYAIHLTTLNMRPQLNIVFAAGQKISGIQLA